MKQQTSVYEHVGTFTVFGAVDEESLLRALVNEREKKN